MSETKFTPGPWEWFLRSDRGVDLRTPNRGQLLILDGVRSGNGALTGTLRFASRTDNLGGVMLRAERSVDSRHYGQSGFVDVENPDARLIKAAPDLYAACHAYFYGEKEARECEVMMRDALAKAHGDYANV